jgi:hypothetical protein
VELMSVKRRGETVPDSPDVRSCRMCDELVLCDPGYPRHAFVVCRHCLFGVHLEYCDDPECWCKSEEQW